MEAVFDEAWVSDEALLARVRREPEAFAALYMRYHLPVYRYLLARLGDEQEAQDLHSMVFIAALHSIQQYRGEGHLLGWLLGIARNHLRMHFRGRRPSLPLEIAEIISDPEADPQRHVESNARLQAIARELRRLPADQAEAISLRVFAELHFAEIARLMNRREGAARMLVQRGLATLRERLLLEEL